MSKGPTWLYFPEWLTADIWHFPFACEKFSRYVPPGSRVLEVGFGSGRILSKVAFDSESSCTGVDVNDGAFKSLAYFAKQQGVEVASVKGDGFCLPFRDGSFDVVYSEGVIEHFPIWKSQMLLEEHVRVCRRGGIVIVSVPNRFALVHSLTKRLLGDRFLFSPESSLSTFQLAGMMSRVGVDIVKRDGFAFGCQFYMFQEFFMEKTSREVLKRITRTILKQMRKTKLYHFENPRLNSLFGFQTMVIGRRSA